MRSEDAVSTRGDQSLTPDDAALLAPIPSRLADLIPRGWIGERIRDHTRGAVPIALPRTWGEACWTARDIWLSNPTSAEGRATTALSTILPVFDVEALERADRWLRRARRRRARHLGEKSESQVEKARPAAAMLALSAKVATWTVTAVVIALAVIVILLGLELGLFDALRQ
jgi:hypothetical protein